MVKCDICGGEFKSKAGLHGHMRFVHGDAISMASGELKQRLDRLESSLGLVSDGQLKLFDILKAASQRLDVVQDFAMAAAVLVDGGKGQVEKLVQAMADKRAS